MGGTGLITGWPSISALRALQGVVFGLGKSYPGRKTFCRKFQGSSRQEPRPPEDMQRRYNRTPRSADLPRTISDFPLWVSNLPKPAWVDLRLAELNLGMTTPPDSLSTSFDRLGDNERLAGLAGPSEVGMCRKLCENGRISEAVVALNLRVQQGYHIHNSLFYLLLKRCIVCNDLVMGRFIHALTIISGYEGDAFLATHLISLYASYGSLEEAMQVFKTVPVPTVYNWTTITFAYARHGDAAQAIRLYRKMLDSTTIQPNNRLYVAILKACATAGDLVAGKEVHSHILAFPGKPDVFVEAGLVSMYARCGSLEDARRVFDSLSDKDVVTWTALIAGYSQQGMGEDALSVYGSMKHEGLYAPDSITYVCLLHACTSVGIRALDRGKQLHAEIKKLGLQTDVVIGGSLVNMYAKCSSLGEASRVFETLPKRNVVTWNALIAGYSQQGMGQEALNLYTRMQQEGNTAPDSVTYVCLLQACASLSEEAVHQGKKLHAQIEERGLQNDLVVGRSLLSMYAKCGSLGNARRVFDGLPESDIVSWNAMIAGYAQHGMGQEALSLYSRMRNEGGTTPDSITYVSLLQACASVGVGAMGWGKQLHAQIEELGLQKDLVLGGSLVNMYAKCGSLGDAQSLFDRLLERDVVTWNVLLAGYAQQGKGEEALSLYCRMQQDGSTAPDSVTYLCLLKACASVGVGAGDQGQVLHGQVARQGLEENSVLGGSLVNMYAKCGKLEDAHRVFGGLPEKSVVTWNALLAGYTQQGMGLEALSLYSRMQQECSTAPDSVTYLCLLQACASVGVRAVDQGKQVHAELAERGLEEDLILGGSLVNMYAKCGSLGNARRVFDRLPERDVVTWNALLAGYARQGRGQEALDLYSLMQQEGRIDPDSVTYSCLLLACATVGVGAVNPGKKLHEWIQEQGLEEDLVLGGSLVNMYVKCGSVGDAHRVFDGLRERDVVTWTALIAGYIQLGMGEEALRLHSSWQHEGLSHLDSVTYVCLLQACVCLGVGGLDQGKQLHAEIEQRGLQVDLLLGGSLVNMYAKCGSLIHGRRVFEQLLERDVATWNVMLAGYTQQGMGQEALSLYTRMQQEGLTPNSCTYVSVLQACAYGAALSQGKQLHVQIKEQGLQVDGIVGAGLVRMYAKCGSMLDSQQVFDSLSQRTIEVWNALTSGYARQGDSEVVFDLVDKMRVEGIQSNSITFLCLLTVCSHVGQVDKGRKYFEAMLDYGISPTIEHYTCMMDLLGRAGHVEEAFGMTRTMPFPPNGVVWRTLLGACRKWKNVEIGKQAFEFAVMEDRKDVSAYVLMSSIYASAMMWKEAKEMHTRRKKCGAWKQPGQSWWTDMGGVVHTFVVGNKNHLESEGMTHG